MLQKFLVCLLVLLTTVVHADEKNDYPELQVTPRASERLAIESEYEKARPYAFQPAITASAAMTLFSALSQKTDLGKDPDEQSKNAGLIVGAGWLAVNAYMAYVYQGYSSANIKVNALPSKTPREQLIKERLSEEEITHLGRLGKAMKWGSFATNFLASGYMLSKSKKDSNSQVFNGVSLVASFLPLIFSNHFEEVSIEQNNYKKKIFGTISSNFLFQDPITAKWNAGVGFVATF